MFGYIRIQKPELKVKEYEMYKAVYCTLCKNLGKNYGFFTRFTLSYDFTFLSLLNLSFTDCCDGIVRKHCPFNPLKKCNYCKDDKSFDMPSAAAMIMLYYKLKDNICDEKFFKKLGYYCLLPMFSIAHKRAKKRYPDIEEICNSYIGEQNRLENDGCKELDKAADPTAIALGKILELCCEDSNEKRVLNRLGYCLGRYIYILDAACDLDDDIKNNSFNVLKSDFDGNKDELFKNRIIPQLYFCINEAAMAFELLNIKKYKPILSNIIYSGLEETFKKELNK